MNAIKGNKQARETATKLNAVLDVTPYNDKAHARKHTRSTRPARTLKGMHASRC